MTSDPPPPPPPPPSLYLVDGYALIYRAFFAMISRPLRTTHGENTSVAWGIANFLHRLFEEHDPTYVAWVHDAGSSFRSETYPDYKATREKLDEELEEDFDRSIERVQELLNAFRVPLIAVDGYEADDVIGTLAHRAAQHGLQAIIVSGDKDFYQLISDRVLVLNPGRGGPAPIDEQLIGHTNARERLGVSPERVVDYLALVGDSSDNIPGVKGIGAKTARALIEQFGELDNILAHASEVKGKRAREALQEYVAEARLSRDLVTIICDVPVDFDPEALRARKPDTEALARLYTELEFNTLIPKLDGVRSAGDVKCDARIVEDAAGLDEVVASARSAEIVALDVRTSRKDSHAAALVGITIAVDEERAWYLPFGHRVPEGELIATDPPKNLPPLADSAMRPLRGLLIDAAVPKVGHDVKRAWLALRGNDVELAGVEFDTSLGSFVLDPGRRTHSLEVVAREILGVQLTPYEEIVGKGKTSRPLEELGVADVAAYCGEVVQLILRLRESFERQLDDRARSLLERIERPLIRVLVDMEWTGICIDTMRLAQLSAEFARALTEIEQMIYDEAGTDFNINSTPQLRHILFEKLQLPVIKRTKTGPSTDADVLGQLSASGFRVPQLLLEYRELSKLKSTYVDVLPKSVSSVTGRVHTTFNQTGAATGRLSSSDPNLQNIPIRTARGEKIRMCFVPAQGCLFIVADYSQIELRVLAHLSQDPAFIAAFGRGGDIHRETAAIIFDVAVEDVTSQMRAQAKTINFATIYGQGPFSLARQLNIEQDEAKEFIRLYFTRFAGVRQFLDDTIASAKKNGFVETLFGRRRYIPELRDPSYNIRAFGERTAMNSPMQGSAADLIKIAMVNLSEALMNADLRTTVLLQVHDELVVESPQAEVEQAAEIVRRKMEGAAELSVPIVVDVGIGTNWLDAKS